MGSQKNANDTEARILQAAGKEFLEKGYDPMPFRHGILLR